MENKPQFLTRIKKTTQDYVPIADIVDGIIITEDKRYISILEILPINFGMKSKEEQDTILDLWGKWLHTSPARFSIKCSTWITPTNEYTDVFDKANATELSNKVVSKSKSHCAFVRNFALSQSITHKFHLIYEYEKDELQDEAKEEEIIQEMKLTQSQIISDLGSLGNIVVKAKEPTKEVCEYLYNFYNRPLVFRKPFLNRLDRYEKDLELTNTTLIEEDKKFLYAKDLVAPFSINTKAGSDYMLIDGMYYSYMYIKSNGYPQEIYTSGWLSEIINYGYGYDVDLFFAKKDIEKTLSQMRRKTRLAYLKLKDKESNSADFEEVKENYDALYYSKEGIKEAKMDPYDMNVIITIFANSKKELAYRKRDLITLSKRDGFELGEFKKIEEEGFFSTSPYNYITPTANKLSKHNVLTNVIQAAYPLTTFSLTDKGGIMMGQHQNNGSLVIYNPFDSTKYSNANMTIFGGSGRGKSFTLLTMTTRLRYLGIQSFILAPDKQDEFRRTCNAIDGEFIDVSASATTRINPFDIWPSTSEADRIINEKTGNETSWLIDKVGALDTWVNMLVQGLTQDDRARIRNCIYETYKKRGITEDNDSLYLEGSKIKKEMPTYTDLVEELKSNPLIPSRVISIFEQFSTGLYKNLNGQTNVDLENKYIVFGMENLTGELKAPMMFILLDFIWSIAKSDKTKNKVIAIDEGSLLVNGKDPLVGDFVVEIFRMIRGYGGSAIFATQSISDLYRNNGEFGNTILSCSHSHMLMGMEASDVKFIQDTLDLSPQEGRMLNSFNNPKMGPAILCAGPIHIPIYVRASKDEVEMFDTSTQGLREIKEKYEGLKG